MKWKADLHVHSKYSNEPTNWLLKKFGGSDCYNEPREIYEIARKKGMNCITITDHNEIQGCLDILQYPNTFISCEVTAKFPEDDCKIHILTYDITKEQFVEMMKIRFNIYELREYLFKNNILHSVAHPIYSVNNKLTVEHFEKLLLLFNTFEINGCRGHEQNEILKLVLNNLTPEIINDLSDKHGIIPKNKAWKKTFTAGSDDHSGLRIGEMHSESTTTHNVREFLENIIINGDFKDIGTDITPSTLAHNIYSIAYQFYLSKFKLSKHVTKDTSLKIIDRLLLNKKRDEDLLSMMISTFRDNKFMLENENTKLLSNSIIKVINKNMITRHKDILKDLTKDNIADKWFEVANTNINTGIAHLINYILNTAKYGNVFDIFHTLGSAGSLYFLIAPYFISYYSFEKNRKFAYKLQNKYTGVKKDPKVVHFTDTYYDVNGVANTLQQTLKLARETGKDYALVTCAKNKPKIHDEKVFEPVGEYEMPTYADLSCYYPPFLEMLDYCYKEDFTHIHVATPGLVGLAALSISKILNKPIYGTYHTAFPQYMMHLTDDPSLETMAWKYMEWYYNQLDLVFVPSNAMKKELENKGIDSRKLKLYPRGVDTKRFRPTTLKDKKIIKLLYVGRVSKEKNLHLLAGAFKKISAEYKNVLLQVVGEGPYLEVMKTYMKSTNIEFLGYKQGDELINLYSSADLFVFPSTTDTFGNVVLEAQACGTPVIVTDDGGPMENIIPGETGIIIKGNSEDALYHGIKSLLDKEKLAKMSSNALSYMKQRSFQDAFLQTWEFYNQQPDVKEQEINDGFKQTLV